MRLDSRAPLFLVPLALGCRPARAEDQGPSPSASVAPVPPPPASAAVTPASPAAPAPAGPCPPEMSRVGKACVDRWEAHLVLASDPERVHPHNQRPDKGVSYAARSSSIVLTGNGKSFVAGADVTRLEKIARGAPLDVAGVPRLPELIATLESSVKPTVAAIEGFALGGGLELALGCHARVGSPLCRVGLPELLLGLIPGAGGTQRLPRLAGVRAASEMMLSSRQVKAEEALRLGILDEVVPSDELVPRAAALARELGKTERRLALERSDRLEPEAEWREILARAGRELQKKQPHVTHPSACLEAIEHGLVHGGCAGLERERELFLEALASEPARALIHLFFAERAAAKVPGVTDAGLSPRHPSRVVVIGGGTMGSGIATALLDAGVGVGLVEASAALGDAAAARIRKNFARRRGGETKGG